MSLAKRQMIVLRGGGDGGGLGRFKHTLIIDTTQILNNFEYISRTVNINSQNKRHFTYITQFTIHFFSHSRSSCKLLEPWLRNDGTP